MQVATLTCTPSKLPLFLLPPPYNTLPPPGIFRKLVHDGFELFDAGKGKEWRREGGKGGGMVRRGSAQLSTYYELGQVA